MKSLPEAIDWMKRCPYPHAGESAELEIRPCFEAPRAKKQRAK